MSNHIDRRSFLRRATGAGVLIAVSQLLTSSLKNVNFVIN